MQKVHSAKRSIADRKLIEFTRLMSGRVLEIAPSAFAAERRLGVPADWLIAQDLVSSKYGTVRTTTWWGRELDPNKTLAQNEAARWDPSENCLQMAEHVASGRRYREAMQVRHDPIKFARAVYKNFSQLDAAPIVDVIRALRKLVSGLRRSHIHRSSRAARSQSRAK